MYYILTPVAPTQSLMRMNDDTRDKSQDPRQSQDQDHVCKARPKTKTEILATTGNTQYEHVKREGEFFIALIGDPGNVTQILIPTQTLLDL